MKERPMQSLNDFDAILYINLAHREDKKEFLLNHLESYGVEKEKIHRIDAVYTKENGHIGCCKSHFKALSYALKKGFKNVLILEDDIEINLPPKKANDTLYTLYNIVKNDWDVLLLGGTIFKREKLSPFGGYRVFSSLSAHAYAVNSRYFETLMLCALESYTLVKYGNFKDANSEHMTRLVFDRKWNTLKADSLWYCPQNLFLSQRLIQTDIGNEPREKGRPTAKFI